jgi:predicted HTH domain antitoxin
MTLTIPDEVAMQIGPTERDVLIEIACRLFDAQHLPKAATARLAGMSRTEFESALIERNLPLFHYAQEMLDRDMEAIRHFEAQREGSS